MSSRTYTLISCNNSKLSIPLSMNKKSVLFWYLIIVGLRALEDLAMRVVSKVIEINDLRFICLLVILLRR